MLALVAGCGRDDSSGGAGAGNGGSGGDGGSGDNAGSDGGGASEGGTPTPTAKLLFKSNFAPGVSLSAPYGFSGRGAWQNLLGTDLGTGFTFARDALLGGDFFGLQLITYGSIEPATVADNIANEITQIPGPDGGLVYALFQNVKIRGPVGFNWDAQSPLMIRRPFTIGDVNDLYISYWFKYQDDILTQLQLPDGNSRTQFAFKTGGYSNDASNGDYRISTAVVKDTDGSLYWLIKGDNVAGTWPRVDYWIERNHAVRVPIGEWFKYELYWHRSSGNDGRFWSAVNGEVMVDHAGPNMGDYNLPINRIFITNPYSGGNAPIQQHVTGLEIWDGFPCGVGVPCASAGSAR